MKIRFNQIIRNFSIKYNSKQQLYWTLEFDFLDKQFSKNSISR